MLRYKREPYEKRLLRIVKEAGYTAQDLLRLSVDEMIAIEHITVPNIRFILCLQRELKSPTSMSDWASNDKKQQEVRTTIYGKKRKQRT